MIIGTLATILAVGTVIALRYERPSSSQSTAPPFSQLQISLASFNLYYPASIPSGLRISAVTVADDRPLASYTISNDMPPDSPASIAISVMQQPTEPTTARTFESGMQTSQTVVTSHGKAIIGTINNGRTTSSSLYTDDGVWILLTTDDPLSPEQIGSIMRSMTY